MTDAAIKSARRVFEVLEYFSEVKRPSSVREIAGRFNYPLISAAVLVRTLVTLGYLSHNRELGVYFPTMRVALLGEWINQRISLGEGLMPALAELAERTGETVILAVPVGIYSQYVHVIPSRHLLQFNPPIGTKWPLCMSGTGIALLSLQSDYGIAQLYETTANQLRGSEPMSSMPLKRVLALATECRRKGYIYWNNLTGDWGGGAVTAMPVANASTELRAVVGVFVVKDRADKSAAAVKLALQDCVAKYQRAAMGGRPKLSRPEANTGKRLRAASAPKNRGHRR